MAEAGGDQRVRLSAPGRHQHDAVGLRLEADPSSVRRARDPADLPRRGLARQHRPRRAAAGWHLHDGTPDLGAAHVENALAVRAPRGEVGVRSQAPRGAAESRYCPEISSQRADVLAVRPADPDETALRGAGRDEGDRVSVGREGGLDVLGGVARDVDVLSGVSAADVDLEVPAAVGGVSEKAAVRRPARPLGMTPAARDARELRDDGDTGACWMRSEAPGQDGREDRRRDRRGHERPWSRPATAGRRRFWRRRRRFFGCRVDLEPGVGNVVKPPRRLAVEATLQEPADGGRRRGRKRRPARLGLQNCRERVGDRLSLERLAPGQHLVENGAEGPDIRPLVDGFPAGLLGRHVCRRADDDARLRGGGRERRRVGDLGRRGVPGQGLGEAEIEDLDLALRGQLHVGRLQVPVNDPLLVRGLERVGDLPRNGEGLVDRDRAGRDPFRQRLALHQLQDERSRAARFLEAVDVRDVRMVERRQDLRLALEARQPLGDRRRRRRAAP